MVEVDSQHNEFAPVQWTEVSVTRPTTKMQAVQMRWGTNTRWSNGA